jgi:hypothetical protein
MPFSVRVISRRRQYIQYFFIVLKNAPKGKPPAESSRSTGALWKINFGIHG